MMKCVITTFSSSVLTLVLLQPPSPVLSTNASEYDSLLPRSSLSPEKRPDTTNLYWHLRIFQKWLPIKKNDKGQLWVSSLFLTTSCYSGLANPQYCSQPLMNKGPKGAPRNTSHSGRGAIYSKEAFSVRLFLVMINQVTTTHSY